MNKARPIAFARPSSEKARLCRLILSGRESADACTRLCTILLREGYHDESLSVYGLFSRKNREDRLTGQTLARALVAAGDLAAAARVYEDLIRRFPGDYLNYKELEKMYLKMGQSRKAVALYTAMAAGHPLRQKGYKRLTGIYWKLGDVARAIAVVKREMKEFGATPKLYRELGKFLLLNRKHVEAIESFQNALAIEKGDRETRIWLGVALMENGNYELAEYEFAELLREKPRDFQALIHMAELRIRENRLGEAREILDGIERRNPDVSRVQLCRAEIAFLEGSHEEAVRRGEAALGKTPFYYIWEQMRCHRILKHGYRALRDVRRSRLHREMQDALRTSRDVFSGLIQVAELKVGHGRNDEGKEILERILDLYPGNSRARIALAEVHLREKDAPKAAEIAEGALKDIPPQFPIERLRACRLLARAYARLGEREKAALYRRQWAMVRAKMRGRGAI